MKRKRQVIYVLLCMLFAAGFIVWGYIAIVRRSKEKTADTLTSVQRLVQMLEDDADEGLFIEYRTEDSRERLIQLWGEGPDLAAEAFFTAGPGR